MAPGQAILAILFVLAGIPMYYFLTDKWRMISSLRMSLSLCRLTIGSLEVVSRVDMFISRLGYNVLDPEDEDIIDHEEVG